MLQFPLFLLTSYLLKWHTKGIIELSILVLHVILLFAWIFRYPQMCPKPFPCKVRIEIISKKLEFLDLLVQNPVFGFMLNPLVNLCAYTEDSIRNYA